MAMTSSQLEQTSLWIPRRVGLLSEMLPPLFHVGSNSSEASAMRWLLDQLVKRGCR